MKASLPVCPNQRSKQDSGLTTTWTNSSTAILARSGRNEVTLVPRNRATPTGKVRPMSSHLAAHSNYPADRRGSHDGTNLHEGSAGLPANLHEGSAGLPAPRLTRRASLMLALVLSLTLWTAIWAAVGLFASVVLGS
jgi:hypothetical protein